MVDSSKIQESAFNEDGSDIAERDMSLLTDEEILYTKQAYHAHINFVDEWVGNITQTLEDKGQLNNTIILFTSDHGDLMNDHYQSGKSSPYEGSAHIPLIVSWPDELTEQLSITAEKGSTSSAITELRDVFPTFYDIAGGNLTDYAFDGSSILSLLQDVNTTWRTYIDLGMEQTYWNYCPPTWNAIVDDQGWKYIYSATDGVESLYNLNSDPYETKQVSSEHPDEVQRLRSLLVAQFEGEGRGDDWVLDGDLVVREESIKLSPNYPESENMYYASTSTSTSSSPSQSIISQIVERAKAMIGN